MSASDAGSDEAFRGQLLRARGRIGLTQRELATRLGVHSNSIQAWEAGSSYPNASSLRSLIEVLVEAGAFTPAAELAEAAGLWNAVMRESLRLRTPFDQAWFASLLRGPAPGAQGSPGRVAGVPPATRPVAPVAHHSPIGSHRQVWGEAPDVAGFVGRAAERALLRRWALDDRCRVIGLFGLGGIGKTLLASRIARDLAPAFDVVYWRSLRDAPAPTEWLAEAIGVIAPETAIDLGEGPRTARLIDLVSQSGCLLILDNLETILRPGEPVGGYAPGHEGYGALLRLLGETAHRSCVLLTSREVPMELGSMRSDDGPVRMLDLAGLSVADGQALLGEKGLQGDGSAWDALVGGCGGNGLALKVVGETILELFDGSLPAYLEYAGSTPGIMVGGVRQLLTAQVERLSALERELLRCLALAREPLSFAELASALGPRVGRGAVLEAVEGLRRRSLLERSERPSRFTLQSVVLEYVTDRVVEEGVASLLSDEPSALARQPLMKVTTKDYVRRSQERLIAAPLLERLVALSGSAAAAESRLLGHLDHLRTRPTGEQGYAPGNVVNLLRLLRGDLRGVDLSRLALRQVALHEVDVQDARLTDAQLTESVLAEAFNYPTAMALSGDGAYLAAGTSAGEICLWRVADRTLLRTWHGHTSGIRGLALGRDGRLLVSGSLDGTVRLWTTTSGEPLMTMREHQDTVYTVSLSGDGRLAASGCMDGSVTLWETASGRALLSFSDVGSGIWRVLLSEDGRLLVASDRDGTVRTWETDSGRLLAEFGSFERGAAGLAFSQDGTVLAVGSIDSTVTLWEPTTGRLLQSLRGHLGGVRGVAVRADGRQVAAGSYDGTVKLWAVEDGRTLATMHGHAGGIWDLALSSDGELLASGSFDGTVRLWETDGVRIRTVLRGYTIGVRTVAASADGRLVVAGSYDGVVRLWSPESGRLLRSLAGHTSGIRGVAVSGDGRLVASGSFDETIRLWDAASGRMLLSLPGHVGGVWGIALSGDGRVVAGGGYDGTIRVWDAIEGRHIWTFLGNTTDIRDVVLSEDGRLLASACEDRTVQVWDTTSGRQLPSLEGHEGGVWGVALTADGRVALSGGDDQTARVWDLETGRQTALLVGHTNGVWGVALTPDGRYAATASFDGSVRLWEAASGQLLRVFDGHDGGVWSVALSADGTTIASGGVDGTVRLWASTGEQRQVLRGDRRYERMDITGLSGVTEAQRRALLALGAVDRESSSLDELGRR